MNKIGATDAGNLALQPRAYARDLSGGGGQAGTRSGWDAQWRGIPRTGGPEGGLVRETRRRSSVGLPRPETDTRHQVEYRT